MQRIGSGLLSVLGLIALAASTFGPCLAYGQFSMASPTALENTRAVAEPSEARPGQTFTLNLTFTVKPGLHIQAHKPLQEGLIGTELTAPPTDGITWKQPQYPPGQERVDELFGTLLEYRGQVQIQLEGVVNPTAQTGRRAIPVKLRYQACNE